MARVKGVGADRAVSPEDAATPAGPELGAPAEDLGGRTVKGLLWAYGAYVGGRALVLVSTAILARLLTPADFGLVALALVFMVFLDAIRDLGLSQALIGSADHELGEQTQTVFVGTVAIGGFLALVTAAIGPLAARFFGYPELSAIIPVLAGNFFLRSLGATHDALARKALNYRARTIADGADVILRGVIGVVLALAGAGVWSLVIGYVVGTAARDVALWAQISWRPGFSFPRSHLRRLVRFGGVLTAVDVLSAVTHNVDYLFVGRVLGSSSLGLYTIGFRLPELLILNLAIVAGDVLFPAYAALDRNRLREGFLISLRYVTVLVLPMSMALVMLARPTVLTLFGSKYAGSIDVMAPLALYAVFVAVNIPAGTIFKVTGNARLLLYTAVPYLLVLVPAIGLAADRGIYAVASVLTACMGVTAAVMLLIASRMLDVSPREMVATVAAPVVATAAMGAAMLPVASLVNTPIVALVLGSLVGAFVYLGAIHLLDRSLLVRLKAMVMPGRAVAPHAAS